jgi:hypothetical protein
MPKRPRTPPTDAVSCRPIPPKPGQPRGFAVVSAAGIVQHVFLQRPRLDSTGPGERNEGMEVVAVALDPPPVRAPRKLPRRVPGHRTP